MLPPGCKAMKRVVAQNGAVFFGEAQRTRDDDATDEDHEDQVGDRQDAQRAQREVAAPRHRHRAPVSS